MIERYGDSFNFLEVFNPDRQVEFTKDIRRVFQGQAPSLVLVKSTYNQETVESWLELQLYNLSEFAGCKEKIDISQIEETARMIIEGYGYLNVVEMMLFFQKFKNCEYGKFYGAVDPMLILGALRDFVSERNKWIAIYDKEEEEEQKRNRDCKRREMMELFRNRYPFAFEKDEELSFSDFHWGGLYKLTQEEWDRVVPELLKKKLPSGISRVDYISHIVCQTIAERI